MSPKEFGFNTSRLKGEAEETILCARVGDLSKRVWHTSMCHAVRKTDQGVERRSRFWLANEIERMDEFGQNIINAILNKPFVKRSLLPKDLGKHMYHHCTQEYNNLGALLPELFRETQST